MPEFTYPTSRHHMSDAGDVRSESESASPQNLLLRALPRRDFERLRPFLETVPLVPRRVIQHSKFPVEYLYFIEEGLVSVLATADERDAVEVWLIGREGVVGGPAVLGLSLIHI